MLLCRVVVVWAWVFGRCVSCMWVRVCSVCESGVYLCRVPLNLWVITQTRDFPIADVFPLVPVSTIYEKKSSLK